jgi:hypothetical protein
MDSFRVSRDLPVGRYKLREVFSGLDDVKPLRACIGDNGQLRRILEETYVTLTNEPEYMYIDDKDGSLIVGLDYLKMGDLRYIYLDIIHELVHVKQHLDGRNLFDKSYSYVDRPTEIEAYRCCVDEGRNIGMTDDTLAHYLYVEWVNEVEFTRLLKTLRVRVPQRHSLRT